MKFQTHHMALIAKYSGISFVAGAVNHGFFSESRSLWTAALGVIFYGVGSYLEMRADGVSGKRWPDLLGWGILTSVGLGFFTGGLQHFPDSPNRSAWVVPLGFFLSLAALYFAERGKSISARHAFTYFVISGALVLCASLGARAYLQSPALKEAQAHGTENAHSHNDTAETLAQPNQSVRNVIIEMDDTMQFSPNQWTAMVGEPLRLIVINKGKLRHELVLGSAADLAEHAQAMRAQANGHHSHIGAISVDAGEVVAVPWTFTQKGTFEMACFEEGHFEAGMKGTVQVGLPK